MERDINENDINTCSNCGALVTANLVKCRQCGKYYQGNAVTNYVIENLSPQYLANSPGTALCFIGIIFVYIVGVFLAGFDSLLSFSPYTTDQLGSAALGRVMEGEIGRILTPQWLHGDILHIVMNGYCLLFLGPLIERFYGRRKFLLIILVSGIFGAVLSMIWYGYFKSYWYGYGAVGFSGAVTGLIGAGIVGGRKSGNERLRSELIKWTIYMVIFGLMVSFVDNAGHLGGFIGGMLVAKLISLGPSKKHFRKINTMVLTLSFATVLAFAHTLYSSSPYGFSLEKDARQKAVMGFLKYGPEYSWENSSQVELIKECNAQKTMQVCKKAFRANPHNKSIPQFISAIADAENNKKDAVFFGWLSQQMK